MQEMEGFYREIHALEGNTPAFPQHYPKGVLLGCVHVVDCVTVCLLTLLFLILTFLFSVESGRCSLLQKSSKTISGVF